MGRPLRTMAGRLVYHLLNRANARMQIFDKPNHWHLVVWPRENGDLSTFVAWLTLTHTQRGHAQSPFGRLGARARDVAIEK